MTKKSIYTWLETCAIVQFAPKTDFGGSQAQAKDLLESQSWYRQLDSRADDHPDVCNFMDACASGANADACAMCKLDPILYCRVPQGTAACIWFALRSAMVVTASAACYFLGFSLIPPCLRSISSPFFVHAHRKGVPHVILCTHP